MSRLVDVYPYREEQNKAKFLIFKRAANVIYANQWRMIGGKVKEDEKYYEAALRELKEECGLDPLQFWTLPSLNQLYDPATDTIQQIPAFGVEVDPEDSIALNHEHSEYKWIGENEIERHIAWPEQRRLMELISNVIDKNEILEEWIINISK